MQNQVISTLITNENSTKTHKINQSNTRIGLGGIFQEHEYARIDTNDCVMGIRNHEMHEIHERNKN